MAARAGVDSRAFRIRLRTKAQEGVADDRASFLDEIEVQIHALECASERQAFEHVFAVDVRLEARRGQSDFLPSRRPLPDGQPRLIGFDEDAGFGKAAGAFAPIFDLRSNFVRRASARIITRPQAGWPGSDLRASFHCVCVSGPLSRLSTKTFMSRFWRSSSHAEKLFLYGRNEHIVSALLLQAAVPVHSRGGLGE